MQNFGNDDGGLHCRVTGKFHHDVLSGKVQFFDFPEEIQEDGRSVSVNRRSRCVGIRGRLVDMMRRLRYRLV